MYVDFKMMARSQNDRHGIRGRLISQTNRDSTITFCSIIACTEATRLSKIAHFWQRTFITKAYYGRPRWRGSSECHVVAQEHLIEKSHQVQKLRYRFKNAGDLD